MTEPTDPDAVVAAALDPDPEPAPVAQEAADEEFDWVPNEVYNPFSPAMIAVPKAKPSKVEPEPSKTTPAAKKAAKKA